jgi:phosphate transport system substrate-binding protein
METAPAGQKGCIDIARSSAPPRGLASDPASFEYYAFALDAVSWASPSLSAPATLTKAQLKDIYACNITDWSQLPGGGSGPIQRYFAQTGSGTGSFFQSDLLDGQDPFTVSSPSCPAPKRLQQSQGVGIANADYQKAILPYSVGAWAFQANNKVNPTLDVRNGVRLGGITTTAPGNPAEWNTSDGVWQLNASGVVNENNVKLNNPTPTYPGIRYMFNTIDTVSPNYAEAAAIVAFTNVPAGTKSPLCSGANLSAILSFGLAPLGSAGNPGGSNLAGARCRKFTN